MLVFREYILQRFPNNLFIFTFRNHSKVNLPRRNRVGKQDRDILLWWQGRQWDEVSLWGIDSLFIGPQFIVTSYFTKWKFNTESWFPLVFSAFVYTLLQLSFPIDYQPSQLRNLRCSPHLPDVSSGLLPWKHGTNVEFWNRGQIYYLNLWIG